MVSYFNGISSSRCEASIDSWFQCLEALTHTRTKPIDTEASLSKASSHIIQKSHKPRLCCYQLNVYGRSNV